MTVKTECKKKLKDGPKNTFEHDARPKSQRNHWGFYNELIHIQIKGGVGKIGKDRVMKRPVGQFKFTEVQREEHNKKLPEEKKKKRIYLTDIGELAFGRFIHYEDERKCWFNLLKKKIAADKENKLMRDLIDDVRVEVGRETAIEKSKKFPEYWIITPPGSFANKNGDTKERHVRIGPLDPPKKFSLIAGGFDIFAAKKGKGNRLKQFNELKELIPNLGPWKDV